MNPTLASLICVCGIAGLFYLDRDRSVRTSKALWVPVIYLWILGSRPVSAWLGMSPQTDVNSQIDGSPVDAVVLGILLIAAIVVLVGRGKRTQWLLAANWPILLYFSYCLISVAWSSHPDVAFKRWIKALEDLAMCLVIVTDRRPIEAIKRLISRVGFVLLPTSLLLIKYYGNFGRGYTPDGEPMNTGVTDNKNMLGVMLFVISLYTLWNLITLLNAGKRRDRRRRLWAQGTLLTFGVILLKMADSKTSIACFTLGAGLVIMSGLRLIKTRPARIHALCLAVLLLGGLTLLFGGESFVTQTMGRQSNLSGRTDIWAALIPVAHNPIRGAGFESFWISSGAAEFHHTLALEGWYQPEGLNEAHNGYLEVYLNLGALGLGLIALILISGYQRAVAAFRRYPSIGGLMTAYIIVSVFYNITEAGLRLLGLPWIFLLLAILTASGLASGVFGEEAAWLFTSRRASAIGFAVKGEIEPGLEIAHAAELGLVDSRVHRQQELSHLSDFQTWRGEVSK